MGEEANCNVAMESAAPKENGHTTGGAAAEAKAAAAWAEIAVTDAAAVPKPPPPPAAVAVDPRLQGISRRHPRRPPLPQARQMVEMEEQCSAADILTALLFTPHQLYTVEHPDRRPSAVVPLPLNASRDASDATTNDLAPPPGRLLYCCGQDSLPIVDDFITATSDFFTLDLCHWAPSTGILIAGLVFAPYENLYVMAPA
ncbi:hypothetical protein OsI_08054 [Oryza sativa Indica Group]|uniref:Uncharacterized protein n=1 Tax=Oryza sativa subsp. indica TaxID=39946 RepID=B8AFE9_ORYSI|nr:hypothetical protein OsI_08054 [Oryza sativa Indica Group]